MKILKLESLLSEDFNHCRYNTKFWGKQQKYLILSICKKAKAVFLNIKPLILNYRTIMLVIKKLAESKLIMVSLIYFHKLDKIDKFMLEKVKNCYYVFLNRWHSFLNGFLTSMKQIKIKKTSKEKTDYRIYRFPSLVLLTKDAVKIQHFYFAQFARFRILSIKCGAFLQKDINVCYNVILENSFKIYEIGKYIYGIFNFLRKKW